MRAIADTGFLVAAAREADRHHGWAMETAARLSEAPLTCEAVLAEATHLLQSSEHVLSLLDEKFLRLDFRAESEWPALLSLARRYRNRQPDLADLCVIRMSEIHPRHVVLTTDLADFTVYRRNGREVIPALFPPG